MDELTQYYYSIYPGLVSAMEAEGIDPRWAGIVAPQVMIETSWGKSPATKYHNYFGMKAAKNQNGVIFSTNEGYGDDTIRIGDSFLAFPSREEGLRQGVRRLRDKFNAFEGKPSTEQYVKNINSNPEQIYFTGNPEDYINNINSIKNGSRAKAAIKQYAKDVRNTFLEAQSTIPNPSEDSRIERPQPIFTPRGDVKKAMQDKVDYHNFMNSISIQNNPQPVYNPPMKFDDGGELYHPKQWNALTMAEKAEMMKVAIQNGITTLPEIRKAYNEFALGGDTVGEWVDAIYQNNPQEEFLGEPSHHYDFTQSEEWANAHGYYPDARGHRDDRVKKPAHPSHPSRGTWNGDKFELTDLGMQNSNYTLFGLNDGGQDPQAILTYKGGSVIPEITITPNGNYFFNPYDNIKLKFAKGGYVPSKTIKDRITGYEGKAMTGARDPISGKYSKNNSFESEAKGFYNALPEDIRDQVLSNPELADSLYSYSYNVGAGNFKKRVVPTLRRYYQGNATVSDIEKSMWASGDSKLRGLQRRRAEERAGVRRALAGNNSIYPTMSSESESLPFTPFYNEIFNTPLSSYNVPTVTLPIEEPLVQAAEDYAYSKAALDRQERQDRLNVFNMLLSMSNPNSSGNSLMDTVGMLTGRNFAQGGRKYDGLTQNNQQMVNPYKPNGGFYYINSEGQAVNPTSRDTIELPEAVVVAKHNSPDWYNREVVQDWDNNGNRVTYEGIQPLVMSATEWARSHSANDLHKMDPYGEIPWNAAAVATGLLAGEVATPYVIKGTETLFNSMNDVSRWAKKAYDEGTIWDKYTTFGGRFGNYGDNIFTNIYGTAARRFGLPDKARVPADAMRKLSETPKIENGIVDFTGNMNYLGNPHTNMTLDQPVVSHSFWVGDGADTYLFPAKNVVEKAGKSLKSIEPSDMFINGVKVTESPKNITLISGDTDALNWARKNGLQALSSPRLRKMYKEAVAKYEKELEAYNQLSFKEKLIQKPPIHPKEVSRRQNLWPEYADEVARLQAKRGTPTLEDFRLLEQKTGLNAGVSPIEELQTAIEEINRMPKFSVRDIQNGLGKQYVYPNGRPVTWSIKSMQEEPLLIQRANYNNVFYDPASYVESIWQQTNGIK